MTDFSADARVNAFILREFREGWPGGRSVHLRECPGARVEDADGGDGSYGCETGCEFMRLEATITCQHDYREDFEYGEFGRISDLIEELEKMEEGAE